MLTQRKWQALYGLDAKLRIFRRNLGKKLVLEESPFSQQLWRLRFDVRVTPSSSSAEHDLVWL